MPNTPISGFTSGAPAQAGDEFVIARSGANFKLTTANLATYIGANGAAGTSGQVQYNNGGAFGGMSGTTWTNASQSLAISSTGTGTGITTSNPVLNLSQTWNAGAVTFTGLKFNATDTASASGSLLLDIGTGGGTYVSKFKVDKSGALIIQKGSSSSAAIQFEGTANSGIYCRSTSQIDFLQGGNLRFEVNGNAVVVNNTSLSFNDNVATNLDDCVMRRGGVGSFRFGNDTSYTNNFFLTASAAATLQLGAADTSASSTVTITIATPGVVTWSSHGLSTGTPVIFSTTGALPTGITAGTTYYVIAVDANTFQIATSWANSMAGTAVNTSGSQSGTQTGTRGAIDQMLRVQSASGTTNFPGADFAIQGSRGTGTGAGGSIIFQVAPAGSSGTAQNAYSTALTINNDARTIVLAPTRTDYGTIGCGTDNYRSIVLVGSADNGIAAVRNTGSVEGLIVRSTSAIGWLNSANVGSASIDNASCLLYRDAANTLALRNGTNAQTFRVYNTYTDASNYERGVMGWTTNELIIGTEAAGTGSDRVLKIKTGATYTWTFSSGNLDCPGSVQAGSTNQFRWASRCRMSCPADSIIQLTNNASNDFDRLQFGGTTSSFPALKRSSATLQVRLADDTGDAALTCGNLTASGTFQFGASANASQLVSQSNTTMMFNAAGSNRVQLGISVKIGSGGGYSFSSTADANDASDLSLSRDAANTLALRNGTNAQQFNVYNTYTDASNYERGFIKWSGNALNVGLEVAGTGTNRELIFVAGIGQATRFYAGATQRWLIDQSGNLITGAASYDIGSPASNRPGNIYAATSIRATGSTAVIGYGTGSGGAVTQATGRTTGVTLNKANGQITLVSAAGTATWQTFTVTNSTVAATDTIIVNQDTGTDLYQIFVTNVSAGAFNITFATTGGTTTEQPVFSFAVIKAVTS